MKFRCVNNKLLEGVLTHNKIYAGEVARHRDFIKIFHCDDGHSGYFEGERFVEIDDTPADGVKINHYFLEVEKR